MFEGLDKSQLSQALEALLFISDEPVNAINLAQILKVETSEINEALSNLQQQLQSSNRGIQLLQLAGGWRLYTNPEFHDLLEDYILSWDTRKLSNAALEVLSIVAYAQPTTRSFIASVRGVASDGPLNTLVERGYVKEVGVSQAPGNPSLYGTTKAFLEHYGLGSLKDLPPLEDFAPDEASVLLIRERLGIRDIDFEVEVFPKGSLDAEDIMADAVASVAGVVEKIDFDKLSFDLDDE